MSQPVFQFFMGGGSRGGGRGHGGYSSSDIASRRGNRGRYWQDFRSRRGQNSYRNRGFPRQRGDVFGNETRRHDGPLPTQENCLHEESTLTENAFVSGTPGQPQESDNVNETGETRNRYTGKLRNKERKLIELRKENQTLLNELEKLRAEIPSLIKNAISMVNGGTGLEAAQPITNITGPEITSGMLSTTGENSNRAKTAAEPDENFAETVDIREELPAGKVAQLEAEDSVILDSELGEMREQTIAKTIKNNHALTSRSTGKSTFKIPRRSSKGSAV